MELQHMQAHDSVASSSAKLARIEVCSACQGHRIEKVTYNTFMVLERTCSTCDGDGVVTRSGPAPVPPAPITAARAARPQRQRDAISSTSMDRATQSA